MRSCLAAMIIGLSVLSGRAWAEEFPFGSADREFEKGFGKAGGISEADKQEADDDRLKIGGELWSELWYYGLQGQAGRKGYVFSPQSVWLYFDARLRDDVRTYFSVETVYEPTASLGSTNPFTGEEVEELTTAIDEAKLFFNAGKTVFFTIGKQKIKWGSGKFWNPTDFLNSERRNLLYNEDNRYGVNLIKTHVPVGSANFYLVNRIEGSNDPGLIQHALRAEVPVGTAEFAATASFLRGEKPLIGADLSTALWDFDAYAEVSHQAGTSRTFYDGGSGHSDPSRAVTNLTAGLSYDFKYSDQDTLTLTVEYFRNGAGLSSTSDYLPVLAAGDYEAYHLSRQYGMFMVLLPQPGRWENVSFTLFNVLNFTDRSAASKLMATFTHFGDLKIDLGVTGHYGESDGELQTGGQFLDGDLRLRVEF